MDWFRQNWLYLGKIWFVLANLRYLGRTGCIRGKTCCTRSKIVVFGQRWFYSGNSGCIRSKVVIFEQKLLYSDKEFVFG